MLNSSNDIQLEMNSKWVLSIIFNLSIFENKRLDLKGV